MDNMGLNKQQVKQGSLKWWICVLLSVLAVSVAYKVLFHHPSPGLTEKIEAISAAQPEPEVIPVSVNAEETYLAFFNTNSDTSAKNLLLLYEQLAKSNENPKIIYDQNWLYDTASSIVTIQTSCQELIDYDEALVPEPYTELHNGYVLASQLYIEALDTFAKAIDAGNDDLMTKAGEMIDQANQYMEDAWAYVE